MYYEDDGWLSPEQELALDEIERLDAYSELDNADSDEFDTVATARWDDDPEEESEFSSEDSEAEDDA